MNYSPPWAEEKEKRVVTLYTPEQAALLHEIEDLKGELKASKERIGELEGDAEALGLEEACRDMD